MTLPELTGVLVAVIGAGGASGLLGKLTERKKAIAEIEAADEARAIGYRDAMLIRMEKAEERALERFNAERAALDECREERGQCREEVSALTSRVIVLEGANAALTSDARRLRERIDSLEKRTSDPKFAAVKG